MAATPTIRRVPCPFWQGPKKIREMIIKNNKLEIPLERGHHVEGQQACCHGVNSLFDLASGYVFEMAEKNKQINKTKGTCHITCICLVPPRSKLFVLCLRPWNNLPRDIGILGVSAPFGRGKVCQWEDTNSDESSFLSKWRKWKPTRIRNAVHWSHMHAAEWMD